MAGHMTAQRLSRLLGQMPKGTIVILQPADHLYFGMSTQLFQGYIDFQTEEVVAHSGSMQSTNDGTLVAVEDHSEG